MMRKTAKTDFLEGVIPAELPTLRAERRSDRRLVTDWIQRGRAEGAFRDGPTPTAASVDEYRRGLIRRGWSYESRVIVSAADNEVVVFSAEEGVVAVVSPDAIVSSATFDGVCSCPTF